MKCALAPSGVNILNNFVLAIPENFVLSILKKNMVPGTISGNLFSFI